MSRPLRKAPGAEAALLSLALDRGAKRPLHVQLAEGLRRLILGGRIAPGARLPSTRALTEEYGIARATAVLAVEQLAAEGFVTSRRGSGLYASATLPEGNLQPARPLGPATPAPAAAFAPWQPFQIEATDPALFPRQALGRHLQRQWRLDAAGLLAPQDGFGLFALRAALAEHLRAWRGIAAEPAQIIITSGFFDGLDIIAAAAFTPRDAVMIEEPGFPPLRHALQRLGLRPIPGLADQAGLDPAALDQALRGVFMAPSRHCPLGGTLSLSRRLAAMLEAMAPLGPYLRPEPTDAGLHLVASLGPRLKGLVTDQEIAAAAAAEGLHLAPLSPLYAGPPRAQGLLLGFAGFTEASIQTGMQRLGGLLAQLAGK